MGDQGLGIVDQHLVRHAPEVPEGGLQAGDPGRLPLVTERRDEVAARVAQCRDEQVNPHPLTADLHGGGAEVDLQLLPRRRLEAHRGSALRLQILAQSLDGALHSAQRHLDPMLVRQLLADDVGIAPMSPEALAEPIRQVIQSTSPSRRPVGVPTTTTQVTLHRLAVAPQLPGDPLRAPTQGLQPDHRRHIVWGQHHVPPIRRLGGTQRYRDLDHSLPLNVEGGPFPHVVQGGDSHVA